MKKINLKENEALVYRSVNKDFQSRNGFQYPKKGKISCDLFIDDGLCNNGLHGLEFGNSISYKIKGDYQDYFLIIKVDKTKGYSVIDDGDKVKFQEGEVMGYFTDYNVGLNWLRDNYPSENKLYVQDVQFAGDGSTQKAGDDSTQNAGYGSTQKAGSYSTQEAGSLSVSILCESGIQKLSKNSIGIVNNYNKEQPKQLILNTVGTYYIKDCQIVKKYDYTPENIDSFEDWEVFVFGSNGDGKHTGGAAKIAKEKFGAIEGQTTGIQGKSFAINTMDGLDKMKEGIEELKKYAQKNTMTIFFLTKIGCGIAGYEAKEIAKLVQDLPANVILPKKFSI